MYLIDQPFHVLSINETRLNENIYDDSVKICGYEMFRKDRNREGGVALYIKTALNANVRLDLVPDGLQAVCVEIEIEKQTAFDWKLVPTAQQCY